ncbi:hypothetical protein [Streptomyces sp. NPDC048639]|uniref:hypothetical protein n=1 Tax=Streptomyces sp. NPDC048639 TaxID=3365581 RepID=UPI00371CDE4A
MSDEPKEAVSDEPKEAESSALRVQAVADGVVTDITAEELRLTLSNGIVVQLCPGHDGSIAARIDVQPDRHFRFVLVPGAANLFFINAEGHVRPTE